MELEHIFGVNLFCSESTTLDSPFGHEDGRTLFIRYFCGSPEQSQSRCFTWRCYVLHVQMLKTVIAVGRGLMGQEMTTQNASQKDLLPKCWMCCQRTAHPCEHPPPRDASAAESRLAQGAQMLRAPASQPASSPCPLLLPSSPFHGSWSQGRFSITPCVLNSSEAAAMDSRLLLWDLVREVGNSAGGR